MKQILVIGAGPAGMMAAIRAAENGAAVTLLEKMKRPGRKMMITGKGRCNITNAADVPEIIRNIHGNGAFLNSSMRAFDNQDVMEFFRQQGVPVKVERGNRVFPVSDKAQDVVDAMVHRLHELDVRIELEMPVADILLQEGRVAGVRTKSGAHYKADAVILAVGGASYPGTGSTGDGYEMAKKLGHTVVPLRPSLVPLETEEEWVKDVQGLSLRNVRATLLAGGEKVQEMFGEMMFTHFGVTGPIILSMSRRAAKCLAEGKFVELELNLKPALTPEKLDARIQRDFEQHIRKSLKNGLLDLLPHKLIEPVLDCAYLDPEKPVHQVTAEERHRLAETLQHLTLTIAKTRPLAEAIVTAGGVSVREINPKTMESKLVPGLYFAGEVVDVDAYTGGYNLQAAFSMGNAAGCWSVWNDD
ncbi:NAD(P)/FAD-dependent oxidoreductase [Mitsuokella jalaludinii]|uniref:NAD(P)/FAD-dependent oxidoreductase n=1 Tax=Mitsuokella jalaludinii TaxID=187979 RepID=UPI001D0211A7|nr:NAD(P)/FAD-dependent oxidoreductase [Mitsuokella jalaludinii]MCB5723864.1 NAD(P)/FAD-dependent oxidoreductase [Mitsuokella jalaludinii]